MMPTKRGRLAEAMRMRAFDASFMNRSSVVIIFSLAEGVG